MTPEPSPPNPTNHHHPERFRAPPGRATRQPRPGRAPNRADRPVLAPGSTGSNAPSATIEASECANEPERGTPPTGQHTYMDISPHRPAGTPHPTGSNAHLATIEGRHSARALPVTGLPPGRAPTACPVSRAGGHAGYFAPPEGHFLSRVLPVGRPSPGMPDSRPGRTGCPGGLAPVTVTQRYWRECLRRRSS